MLSRIGSEEMAVVFQQALQKEIIERGEDNTVIFYDLDRLAARLRYLERIFPNGTLHAVAVKTNPLIKILSILNELGAGAEVASIAELQMARHAGAPPDKIVFDSPAKTIGELKAAIHVHGVHINADSLEELARIASLQPEASNSSFGIRINPQIETESIASMQTGGGYSKFGVPIRYEKELVNAFLNYEWLSGVHVHVGSQLPEIDDLVQGVRVVYEFALEMNRMFKRAGQSRRIEVFDMGGGFPVSYREGDVFPEMSDYVAALKRECPQLFTEQFRLITEFGRYVHAAPGWVASKVEYVKHHPDVKTAIIHVGADLFLRECYNPNDWYHQVSVLNSEGLLRNKRASETYNIAGPLCFGGDIIARKVSLPLIRSGDYTLIHDTGANALSLWSRHCSRQVPKVVGYTAGEEGYAFTLIKGREKIQDVMAFWS